MGVFCSSTANDGKVGFDRKPARGCGSITICTRTVKVFRSKECGRGLPKENGDEPLGTCKLLSALAWSQDMTLTLGSSAMVTYLLLDVKAHRHNKPTPIRPAP